MVAPVVFGLVDISVQISKTEYIQNGTFTKYRVSFLVIRQVTSMYLPSTMEAGSDARANEYRLWPSVECLATTSKLQGAHTLITPATPNNVSGHYVSLCLRAYWFL